LGEHTASHVDAPFHFDGRPGALTIDQVPLENFYTDAVCLDLSHKPLKSDISIADLRQAIETAEVDIRPRDTVLLHMGHYDRTFGTPAFLTDFPGLVKESAEWLGAKGITAFGVEAVSPGRPGKHNFEVHLVCRDMGFTHYEGLANLHKVVGKGRFKFIAFPLKIRGGTGSPVRAVAVIED
jgi:kynurenine formamidase